MPRAMLATVLVAYVTIAALYAVLTPAWQVPDEPAHYNYIRSLAQGPGFPTLEQGDYDQALLSELTSERFPPELSTEPLEYEDHQPPLYYLLATPLFVASGGALLPLRLLSVLLGALLLGAAYGIAASLFPGRPGLALTATACVAFVPQHVAMTAGVNNDALGELALAGALWLLVLYVGRRSERPWPIGLLLGAALLAKTTAYVSLGVAAFAVLLRWRTEHRTWGWALGQLAMMFLPALALSAPWFIRNGLTYGWADPLGLVRHDAVVAGQPRSSEWLAEFGWQGLLSRMLRTTFQSFWGQFGWMGVVLPARVYQLLALVSALLAAGFLWWVFDRRRPRLGSSQRLGLIVMLASSVATLCAFLWYNLNFVQHQGRYLFPALVPIGIAAALGLDTLSSILPRRVRPLGTGAFFVGLAALDVYCLFAFIIPSLAR